MPKDCDSTWQSALTMAATGASTTIGSSTTTQSVVEIRRATHVAVKVSGLTLAGGISLRVYFMIGDNASTPVYGYQHDIGGTEFYIPCDGISGTAGALPAVPVDGYNLKLDVTVSATDATAACTLEVMRIYQT
jgi:hypothetical protein